MEKNAIKLGKLGSALGILVGLIEMSIGAQILPWIGINHIFLKPYCLIVGHFSS